MTPTGPGPRWPDSVIEASPVRTWDGWHQLPTGLALLVVLVLALTVAIRPPPVGVRNLSGTWSAEVTGESGVERRDVELPGLFVHQGLPADARVHATREVTAGSEPMAVLIDTPQYAVAVTWDGRVIGGVGDPNAAGRDARSGRSAFVVLPPAEPGSRHRLGLDLKGDYGKGGVTGRILLGPVGAIHEADHSAEVQRLALVLGLSLLAALPLVVATRRIRRPAYAAFGLFATSLALLSFGQANLAYEVLPDALAALRLRRFVSPLVVAFGVSFASAFVSGRNRTSARVVLALGCALSALGMFAPPSWLYGLETASDTMYFVGIAVYLWLLADGLRRRVPGTPFLAGSLLPLLWGVVSEITLTHGLRTGASQVLASTLGFAVLQGVALVLRDAQVSEQHDRLVRGSLDAMVTVDPDGRIRDANPAARHLLRPVEPGETLLHAVLEADQPFVRAHLARAGHHSDRSEFRTRIGKRVLESLATPLGPGMLMLTLRDITARREIDRGLLQAARMETVGLLLGGIAHDFNNMLGNLLAHLGLLRVKVDNPELRDRIDRMEGTVDRASDLTRRLLTVARGTGSDLGPVDLAAIARGAAELVEPTLPVGVQLTLDLPTDLPPVLGDPGDLEQVLVNLLVNGRDALAGEGHLRLAARSFRTEPGERGRGVAVMVEDDGPGLPDERKEEVFHPFVTTKPSGTGLGLAVARQILRDHHGRIWVEDRPGGGARFLLALRHADAVDEAPAPLPKGRRILLVEDEQVLLDDYAGALLAAGYEPVPFSNASAASAWLTANQPDLLVTDIVMPGVNGLELARTCRELYPRAPVLLVSAFIPDESLRELQDGAVHALHKPIRAARLVSTVGRLARRAERGAGSDEEITWVSYLFPDLEQLTAASLGFDEAPPG